MTQSAPKNPERHVDDGTSLSSPARYPRPRDDGDSRRVRPRWVWFVVVGSLLMIAGAIYLYSEEGTFEPTDRAFPNYMQNTDR